MDRRSIGKLLAILMMTVSFCCLSACGKHEHSYAEGWYYDENYHWRLATCDDLEDKKGFVGMHNFVDGFCTLCGCPDPDYVEPSDDPKPGDTDPKDDPTLEEPEDPAPPEGEGSAERPKPPEDDDPSAGSPEDPENPDEDDPLGDDFYDSYFSPDDEYTRGEETLSDGLKFTELLKTEDGTLSGYAVAIAYNNREARQIDIPATYENLPVLMVDKAGFTDCERIEKIALPDGMLYIGEEAFRSCDALWSVEIPSSVWLIEKFAFLDCGYLTQLNLCEGLREIRYGAFKDCGVEKLTIPNTVHTIASQAFFGCNIKEATIGSGLKSVGGQAFCNCGIGKVYISDLVAWCNISFVYDNSNPLNSWGSLYLNGELVKKLEIPEGCGVKKYSFFGCASIEEVTIPSTADRIGEGAFAKCASLGKVNFKEGASEIDSFAFSNCYALKEIVLPDSVKTIRIDAFYYCGNLSKIVLGKGLSLLEMSAFVEISKSAEFYYRGSEADWKKIVKNSSWTSTAGQIHYDYKDE